MSNVGKVSAGHAAKLPWLQSLAIVVASAAGLVILMSPHVDLTVANMFYIGHGRFIGNGSAPVHAVRNLFLGLYAGSCVVAVCGLVITRNHSRRWQSLTFAQWLFLAVCLGAGPGIVANLATKDQWGRARPIDVVEFGGAKLFTGALVSSNQCVRNCSFVSGEASSMFTLFFAAAFTWRNRWRVLTAAGIGTGLAAGLIRMMQGAHFLTDVLFAGIFMAMTVVVIRFMFDAIATSARNPQLAESHPNLAAA